MLDGALGAEARTRRVRLGGRARPWVGTLSAGSHPTEGRARRGVPVSPAVGCGARRTTAGLRASERGAPRDNRTK